MVRNCPCCGGSSSLQMSHQSGCRPVFFVRCSDCGLTSMKSESSYLVLRAWNRRVLDRVKTWLLSRCKKSKVFAGQGSIGETYKHAAFANVIERIEMMEL